jgi:hypothetical protein
LTIRIRLLFWVWNPFSFSSIQWVWQALPARDASRMAVTMAV